MMRAVLILVGLAFGGVVGWLLDRLPMPETARSAASALIASVLTTVAVALVWARWSVDEMSIRAVSIDLFRGAIGLIIVAVAATALHFILGWLGQAVHPTLGSHRPLTLGVAAGVVSAFLFGSAVATVDTLR